MSTFAYAGIIMILAGLFEMLITPLILQRLWARQKPPHTGYVLRMIRGSGFMVAIMGVLFLLGLFG